MRHLIFFCLIVCNVKAASKERPYYAFDLGEYVYKSLSLYGIPRCVTPTFSPEALKAKHVRSIEMIADSGDFKGGTSYAFDTLGRLIEIGSYPGRYYYQYDSTFTQQGKSRVSLILLKLFNDDGPAGTDSLSIFYDSLARPVKITCNRPGDLADYFGLQFNSHYSDYVRRIFFTYSDTGRRSFVYLSEHGVQNAQDTLFFDHYSGELYFSFRGEPYLVQQPFKIQKNKKKKSESIAFYGDIPFHGWIDTGGTTEGELPNFFWRDYPKDTAFILRNASGELTAIDNYDYQGNFLFFYSEGIPSREINSAEYGKTWFHFEICRFGEKNCPGNY
jgi:hypothetical protein